MRGVRGAIGQRALPVSHDNMLTAAILDHFREIADASKVYALDLVPNTAGEVPIVRSLGSVVQEPLAKRRLTGQSAVAARGLHLDVEGGDENDDLSRVPGQGPVLHFKLLHAKPSAMKTVKVPVAAGRRLVADEVSTRPETFMMMVSEFVSTPSCPVCCLQIVGRHPCKIPKTAMLNIAIARTGIVHIVPCLRKSFPPWDAREM